MPIDDPASIYTCRQCGTALRDEAALDAVDAPDGRWRKAEPRIEQKAPIGCQAPRPLGEMRAGGYEDRVCPPIKAHQCGSQAIKLRCLEALLEQDTVEGPLIIEADHENKPVGYHTGAPNGKTVGGDGERCDVDVDVRSEPAVEAALGPAGGLSALQR